MANYSRRERITKHIEYTVPVWADHGAAIGEVLKALHAAENEAVDLGKRTDCDDWAWVVPADEHVIIRFEVAIPAPAGQEGQD